MPECIFCDIISGKIPAQILFENGEILAVKDISPQAPVHLLVFPKKHIPTLLDLTEEDEKLIGKMVIAAGALARENKIDEKGFRLVFNCNKEAGQSVYHIHMHLLGGRRMAWPPG